MLIDLKVRVEGDAQHAAFTGGVDRQRDEWRREQHAIADHANGPALLADKQAAIWRELHGGGTRQSVCDDRFAEARG